MARAALELDAIAQDLLERRLDDEPTFDVTFDVPLLHAEMAVASIRAYGWA